MRRTRKALCWLCLWVVWRPVHGWQREFRDTMIYIAIEFVIGISGFVFHDMYLAVTGSAYRDIFPILSHPHIVEIVKNALAGLLILPQSTLLGMTFPLMTVGVLRRVSGRCGDSTDGRSRGLDGV